MTILVVGISHRSAPIALLERFLPSTATAPTSWSRTCWPTPTSPRPPPWSPATGSRSTPRSTASTAVSRTCPSGCWSRPRSVEAMLPHLYVHYDDGAVAHLFQVAAGLDSMAVGEAQILGQTRAALARGQEQGSVGPVLNTFCSSRRCASASAPMPRPASTARHRPWSPPPSTAPPPTSAGAGSSSSARVGWPALPSRPSQSPRRGEGAAVNRSRERGLRLAGEYDARWAPLTDLATEVAEADVVVACAGATGLLLSRETVAAAGQPPRWSTWHCRTTSTRPWWTCRGSPG